MRRLALLALLIALSACDEHKSAPNGGVDTARAAPSSSSKSLGTPEPWTLGAARARDGLALPPPCRERAETLRGVLSRETRIAAAPATGGVLLVGEGSLRPAFELDAAGLMTMTHGRGSVRRVPWPTGERPLLARGKGKRWLLALSKPAQPVQLFLWRNGEREHLGSARALDLRCGSEVCALLTTPLEHAEDAATLLVGRPDEAVLSWQRVRIDAPPAARGKRPSGHIAPFGIERISEDGSGWRVLLTLHDDWRVLFVSANSDDDVQPLAALDTPHGALDALATPAPIAMARGVAADPRSCVADGGGVVIVRRGAEPMPLRATAPPQTGSLHSLRDGALAAWLGRARCESSRRVLYAATLKADGTPVGPVTTVADADEYAIATRDDELDLWVRSGRQITWTRAHCRRQ